MTCCNASSSLDLCNHWCYLLQASAADHGPSRLQLAGVRAVRKITPTAPGEAARAAPRVRLPEGVAAALRRGDGDARQAALRAAFVAQYSGDGEPVRRELQLMRMFAVRVQGCGLQR